MKRIFYLLSLLFVFVALHQITEASPGYPDEGINTCVDSFDIDYFIPETNADVSYILYFAAAPEFVLCGYNNDASLNDPNFIFKFYERFLFKFLPNSHLSLEPDKRKFSKRRLQDKIINRHSYTRIGYSVWS